MRATTMLVLLFVGMQSYGQSFTYPILPASGKSVKDFIPKKWFLLNSSVGDLNDDSIPDLAFVLQYKDTINEVRPDSSVNRARPVILVILFKNKDAGLYHLVIQNNTFIIRSGEGGVDLEAFEKLSISKCVLSVVFDFPRGPLIYKFRYQKGDFYLIGAISNGAAGGEFYIMDVNFLTGRAKDTSMDPAGEHEKIEWHNISVPNPVKLKELKMLFTIEVLPGVYF